MPSRWQKWDVQASQGQATLPTALDTGVKEGGNGGRHLGFHRILWVGGEMQRLERTRFGKTRVFGTCLIQMSVSRPGGDGEQMAGGVCCMHVCRVPRRGQDKSPAWTGHQNIGVFKATERMKMTSEDGKLKRREGQALGHPNIQIKRSQ